MQQLSLLPVTGSAGAESTRNVVSNTSSSNNFDTVLKRTDYAQTPNSSRVDARHSGTDNAYGTDSHADAAESNTVSDFEKGAVEAAGSTSSDSKYQGQSAYANQGSDPEGLGQGSPLLGQNLPHADVHIDSKIQAGAFDFQDTKSTDARLLAGTHLGSPLGQSLSGQSLGTQGNGTRFDSSVTSALSSSSNPLADNLAIQTGQSTAEGFSSQGNGQGVSNQASNYVVSVNGKSSTNAYVDTAARLSATSPEVAGAGSTLLNTETKQSGPQVADQSISTGKSPLPGLVGQSIDAVPKEGALGSATLNSSAAEASKLSGAAIDDLSNVVAARDGSTAKHAAQAMGKSDAMTVDHSVEIEGAKLLSMRGAAASNAAGQVLGGAEGFDGLRPDSANTSGQIGQARYSAALNDSTAGVQHALLETANLNSTKGADAALLNDVPDVKVDVASGLRVADARVPETSSKPYVSSLALPVDDAEWSEQLNQKMMWMSARNIQSAELHLNPADMGPIEIKVQIGAEQSSINFNTQNHTVRELLEANIHRLRDMLNNGDQQMSDAGQDSSNDSSDTSQGADKERASAASASEQPSDPSGDEAMMVNSQRVDSKSSDQLVDAFV